MIIQQKSTNNILLLRYILTSMVIFSHTIFIGKFLGIRDMSFMAFNGSFENLGGLAVGGFFILSGYLITGSYIRLGSFFQFIKNRFIRIFPGYWLCLFLTAFLLGPLVFYLTNNSLHQYFSMSSNGPFSYMIRNAFLYVGQNNIHTLFKNNPAGININDSLWTLGYEFICYLSIGLLGGIISIRNSKKITAFIFFALYLTFNIFFTHIYLGGTSYFFALFKLSTYFYMGSVIYQYRSKIHTTFTGLAVMFLLTICFILYRQFFWIAPFSLAYFLFYFIEHIPLKTPKHIGDYSYGLYLYAWPSGQLLAFLGLQQFGFPFFLTTTIGVTMILAILSYYIVERPSLRLRNS